jgi:hypothetical protein
VTAGLPGVLRGAQPEIRTQRRLVKKMKFANENSSPELGTYNAGHSRSVGAFVSDRHTLTLKTEVLVQSHGCKS